MKYGLIGGKLVHSFSKEIHSRLCSYEYELKELSEKDLPDFLKNRDFSGINVTIPYKTAVIGYLDEIDDAARQIGAVNTIVNRNGKLYGYNTDAFGLLYLIKKNGIGFDGKRVLILGSGGTSKTAEFVAKNLKVLSVMRVSRKQKEGFITYAEAENLYNDADIIINTTPCGMFPDTENTPIDLRKFQNLCAVIDVIYNPLKTRLILGAEKRGLTAAGGLYMLVMQAVGAAELFTGEKVSLDKVNDVYRAIKREKQNIVLIGMPSSGKTTIGKELSNKLGMPFFDSDEVIKNKTGRTPAEIIRSDGEPAFRKLESEVISELSKSNHIVIATGGGAPTVYDNVLSLKSNGRVYFIDRPYHLLEATPDRPLSSSKEALRSLYESRIDVYRAAADVRVNNDCDIEYVENYIRKDFCYEDTCD